MDLTCGSRAGRLDSRVREVRARLADGERPRPPRLSAGLELRDLVLVAQGEPDVVEPFEKPPPSVIVDVEIDALQIQRPSTIDQTQGIVDWTIQGVPLPVAGNDQLTITFR